MNRIKLDKSKCIKCGLCSTICPVSIVDRDGDSYPYMNEAKEFLCVRCGHCESHCPKDAITFDYGFDSESPVSIDAAVINEKDLSQYLKNRRSVRHFKSTPVGKETIEKVFDVVRYAPSGKNYQPVKWIIIHDTNELKRIMNVLVEWVRTASAAKSPAAKMIPSSVVKQWEKGNDIVMRNAPHLAVAYVPKDTPMGDAALFDAVIALAHFDIVLPAFGLGGFWAGFFTIALRHSEEVRSALGIPADHIPCYAYGFGYPKYTTSRIPRRKGEDVVWL
jgi:nitroreductase/NAD-dependent dihydropyrimidine dehydrogenase PreA subunit